MSQKQPAPKPNRRSIPTFKLQLQDDDNDARSWHDVKGPNGELLKFEKEADARAKLEELFPLLVKMEHYAGPKRTSVIIIIEDEDDWQKKK